MNHQTRLRETNLKRNFARVGAAAVLLVIAGGLRAAEGPFHDKPASPRSLPADNLPPFRMLDADGNLIPLP
jgi:hypothetical protein